MKTRVAWGHNKVIQSNNDAKGGFYASVKWVIFIAKYVGLLPLNIKHSGSLQRRTWKSLCVVWFLYLCLIVNISIVFLYFSDILSSGFSISKSNELFRHSSTVLLKMFLLRFSNKWEVTLKEIEIIEMSLPLIRDSRKAVNIGFITMITMHGFSLFHYSLYVMFTVKNIEHCFNSTNMHLPSVKIYFLDRYPWFYKYFQFNYVTGIILQLNELQGIFLRCFVDELIMIVSIYLKKRIEEFNRILEQKQYKVTDRRPTWCDLQIQYTRLSYLVKVVDGFLNPLIFLSFFFNLLYIAQLLYYTLNKLTKQNVTGDVCLEKHKYDLEPVLYMSCTFIFTIMRIMFLSFLSSEVHAASRKPLNALYVVPSTAYNVGMYRLMNQVYNSNLALTGFNFFSLTRGTIMSMVATLMTYELVLLQI